MSLQFDAASMVRIINHMLAAKEWRQSHFEKDQPRPQVILVHDEGIYLMSNGLPRDVVEGDRSFCAYAEGFDPTKQDRMEVWEAAREMVGGDDFAEFIDLSQDMIEAITGPDFDGLEIEVFKDAFVVKVRAK